MEQKSNYPVGDMLPAPTLSRLPGYLAYVSILKDEGVEYVSSTQISKEINVDASMIAKDLSFLNIKGKTRIGYDVATLEHKLQEFLGFRRGHNAVMIGVGSLGASLIQDSGLAKYGLRIVAGFDVRRELIGTSICGVPVYDMADFGRLIGSLDAGIGIIAVPMEIAQKVCDEIVLAGIRALWNFTPMRIKAPSGIVVQDTSIYADLAVMYNRLDNIHK